MENKENIKIKKEDIFTFVKIDENLKEILGSHRVAIRNQYDDKKYLVLGNDFADSKVFYKDTSFMESEDKAHPLVEIWEQKERDTMGYVRDPKFTDYFQADKLVIHKSRIWGDKTLAETEKPKTAEMYYNMIRNHIRDDHGNISNFVDCDDTPLLTLEQVSMCNQRVKMFSEDKSMQEDKRRQAEAEKAQKAKEDALKEQAYKQEYLELFNR
jgi:hypothetical protein